MSLVNGVELQVHFLGSSADLTAARRTLEARRVVRRARLTPGVTAVVADSTVRADHPTIIAAHGLGIAVLAPAVAVDRLLRAPNAPPPAPLPVVRTSRTGVAVIACAGALALLGAATELHDPTPASHTTTVEPTGE